MADAPEFMPVTLDRLAEAEAVIGGCGVAAKCWCAYRFRPAAECRRDSGAGFAEVARPLPRRAIMRRELDQGGEP